MAKALRSLAVVFDWDGVLFNTAVLKKVREGALAPAGHSAEAISAAARKVVDSGRGYSLENHARALVPGSRAEAKKTAAIMRRAIERHPGDFLFPDARRTIAVLKRRGYAIDILTAGHAEFQEYKITRSGARKLFRNVHIVKPGAKVPKNKIAILRKLARTHEYLIFLDDRADTIAAVRKAPGLKGKVIPVLVWRQPEPAPRANRSGYILKNITWKGLEPLIRDCFR